jgi:cytoskeleton protein RodZ
MATFGENLRREREMRGVSLEEIADATKIGVRTLRALEADEFEKLPGGIFTRSFVRTYAKYLGLDEESIMAEFQLVAPPSAQTDLRRMSQQRPPRPKEGFRGRIAGLVIAVAMLAGGYGLYRYTHRVHKLPLPTAQPAPPVTSATGSGGASSQTGGASQVPAVEAATTNSGPGTEGAATQTSASSAPQESSTQPPAPAPTAESPLVLQVAATEKSWVAVESDGKPVTQRVMEPNEIQTFRAKFSFDVITGNAEGIILTLNGKTLDPLGHQGEVRKVHLTLHDVQNTGP